MAVSSIKFTRHPQSVLSLTEPVYAPSTRLVFTARSKRGTLFTKGISKCSQYILWLLSFVSAELNGPNLEPDLGKKYLKSGPAFSH
jgi:hypothetical protein